MGILRVLQVNDYLTHQYNTLLQFTDTVKQVVVLRTNKASFSVSWCGDKCTRHIKDIVLEIVGKI